MSLKLNKNSKIFLAGHNGLVGSAILKKLREKKYKNIYLQSRKKLDLTNQIKTYKYLKKIKPDYVIIAAAKVGGINANNLFPAEFIHQNLSIEVNLIEGSFRAGVKNLLFLGSSCIYPKNCKQPIKEDNILNGRLEKTNEAYSIAKITGIKMCEFYSKQYKVNYKSVMPCNVFGPNDNYDLSSSHFIPALIKKIHLSKTKNLNYVNVWGSGRPKREVIFSEELAEACIFILKNKTRRTLINIGTDIEFSINQYAKAIMRIIGHKVKIKNNLKYPDGVKRKKLDTTILNELGWKSKLSFDQALKKTYSSYIKGK